MKININVLSVLLIILVTLKVMNLTEITWFWVFCPLWAPILLCALIFGGLAAFLLIRILYQSLTNKVK